MVARAPFNNQDLNKDIRETLNTVLVDETVILKGVGDTAGDLRLAWNATESHAEFQELVDITGQGLTWEARNFVFDDDLLDLKQESQLAEYIDVSDAYYNVPSARYNIYNGFSTSRTFRGLTAANGWYFRGINAFTSLNYTGTGTVFEYKQTDQFLQMEDIFLRAPNASQCFDVDGISSVVFKGISILSSTPKVGTIQNTDFLTWYVSGMNGATDGLTIHNVDFPTFVRAQWSFGADLNGIGYNFTGTGGRCLFLGIESEAKSTEKVINIGASYTGDMIISSASHTDSGGTFLNIESGYTGTVTIIGAVFDGTNGHFINIPNDFAGQVVIVGGSSKIAGGGTGSFFDPAGKNQDSLNVSVVNVSGIPNTDRSGAMSVIGNTIPTALDEDVWTDIDLNASAVDNTSGDYWELADATTGAMRFLGDEGGFLFNAIACAYGAGSSSRYNFRVVLNDGLVDIPIETVRQTNDMTSAISSTAITAPIAVQTNWTVRLQVRNESNDSDIVFYDYNAQMN